MKYTYCVVSNKYIQVSIYSGFNSTVASNKCRRVVDTEDTTANYYLEKKMILEGGDNMYWSECE